MRIGRVFVFQPTYMNGVPGSHRAFWTGGCCPGDPAWNKLDLASFGGSLLANTFNQAWVRALNDQLDGHDITHFAMLHDDVVPEDGWVSRLLEDLESSGVDLVSAVVPIKGPQGLTSTAIDDPTDEYQVLRRITMQELDTLPDVFTAWDCGYTDNMLLANTGCWACRLDRVWRFKIKFEIRDRIVLVMPDGQRLPQVSVIGEDNQLLPQYQGGRWVADVDPEDWNLSRQLQRLGGKVAVTKRVKLLHQGQIPFANYPGSAGPWGQWDYDHNLAHKFGGKPIVGQPSTDSTEPRGVRGWMTNVEGRGLRKLAAGKRVLEIGSFCGLSTIWMAHSAESLTAVDTFDSAGTQEQGDTLTEFIANLKRYNVIEKVYVHQQDSRLGVGDGEVYDVVFIDGAHDRNSVLADIKTAVRVLKPGGVLAFHDYDNDTSPAVPQVVNGMLGNPVWELERTFGSIAVLRHVPENHKLLFPIKESNDGGDSNQAEAGSLAAAV